jgi:uncharacterized repeat protein (TIGR01451 family)
LLVLPKLIVKQTWFALVAALMWPCFTVFAGEAVPRSSLTNFDVRAVGARANAKAAQHAGHAKLKESVPDANADFDPVLGSPKWIHSHGDFLTGANGEGRAVSDAAAKRFDKDPDKAVKAFLHEHRELFRHGPEVLETATKKRDHTNSVGLRMAAWEQQVDGIPVFESVFVSHTGPRGELISVSSLFIPEPDRAADRGTPNRAAKARGPSIDAERALRAAAANVGEEISELTPEEKPVARTLKQTFRLKPLPGDATATLVWLPLDGDTLRLCWEVELNRREFSERFRLVVDAETGAVLIRRKLTLEVREALYRVYTSDSPSPLSPGLVVPGNTQPPYVQRQLLAISNLNSTASPLGWVNDGVTQTRGNNVDAHLDRDNDDRPDLPRIEATNDVAGRVVFDFPIQTDASGTPTQSPFNYSAAAVVQLFYWCNFAHDKLYELGFTESLGNFQKDNFGKGGADNDAMLAQAQDGSGFNNANFTLARDGSPGKIQMYIFNTPSPARDGDFDAEVILHEYAHGLADRLIGGGVGMAQLQTFGMSEGWSDFYGEALLSQFGDDLGGNYAVGGYVTYQFSGLSQNYYYGFRRYPYTTNLNVNPLTFKDIDFGTAASHPGIPRNPIITSGGNEVHRQGEIWCSMLWDMRAALIRKYAPTNATQFTNANMRVLAYVTEGLRQCPPNPNFVQARDALRLAIQNLGGGSDTNEMWAAFARRGLGLNAVCPDSSTTVGVVESYDSPMRPEFTVQPFGSTFAGTAGGPFIPMGLTNILLSSASTNVNWSASVNDTWLQLSATNGVLFPNVPVTNVVTLTAVASSLSPGDHPASITYTYFAGTQVVTLPVSLKVNQVQDDPLLVSPPSIVLTPPDDTSRSIQLANNSQASLSWSAFTTNNWLTVTPTNGVFGGSGEFTNVTVALNSNATVLADGTYTGNVAFINANTGKRTDVAVLLRIGRVDYLTEDFANKPFDLSYSTLTFRPDLSDNFYRVCREPASTFPTSPEGGTLLALGDDEYRQITLTNGVQVALFGRSTNAIFIGANGNLTFDPAIDTSAFFPGLGNYFTANRACALYTDLNPAAGGTVTYLQLLNRFVVTYENVPEFSRNNSNSLQIEMFLDGGIRMTWLRIDATNNSAPIVGLSRGLGVPSDFTSSDLSAFGACAPDGRLVLPSTVTEGEIAVLGTVLLSEPATNDMLVTFTSSDTNEIIITDSVIIRTGHSITNFGFDAIDDGIADGSRRATITAHFPDRPSASASIQVHDAQTANLTLNVPSIGGEGTTLVAAGVVNAGVIAVKPIAISLLSGNTNRVRVPPVVIVEPGQSLAYFDLTLVDNNLFDGTENIVVEAAVPNWGGDFDVIRVNDNENRTLIVTLPPSVTEGQGTRTNAGKVSFQGKLLTNVVIALQSDHPELVTVPGMITITNLLNPSSTNFDIVVTDNTTTNGFDHVRITASVVGFITGTGTMAVVDDERPFAPANPSPANFATGVARNTMLSWTVNTNQLLGTIYDVFFGTNADLSISSPIASTMNHSVTLPGQLEPDTTYYWQVLARLMPFPPEQGPLWQFTTTSFGLQMNPIGSPQFVGEPFPLVVRAVDTFGLPVENYAGPLTLTNYAPMPSQSKILITEIDVSGVDRVEFQNVSDQSINISGWRIVLFDWQTWPVPLTTYIVPSSTLSRPGEIFQLRSILPQFFPGAYPVFSTAVLTAWNNNADNNQTAVLLLDALGNIVDFVCAAGADPALITLPMAIPPQQWSSTPIVANLDGNLSYQRVGRRDMNSSNDWVLAARGVGTNNVGLSSSFSNNVPVAFTATPFTFVSGVSTSAVTMLAEARNAKFGVSDAQAHGALSNPFDVMWRNDILLSLVATNDVLVNNPISYRFSITNVGPNAADGVTLIDSLATNSAFSSATPSQGACSVSNGTVTCELGTLPGGAVANVTIVAHALSRGLVTNVAVITRSGPDGNLANNTASAVTTATFPQVSVLDSTTTEPSVGGQFMTFNVRLSAPSSLTSTVLYATADGTATAGVDYIATNGVVTFAPGITNQSVSVPLIPDFLSESNETLFVNLSAPTNLELNKTTGTGILTDNDGVPGISVTDVTVVEGDSGMTTAAFTVQLSAPSGKITSVGYGTANNTAIPGFDYQHTYGFLVFPPGLTNLTVNVPVLGDLQPEPTKTFFLNIANAGNGLIIDSQGVGTIVDNDVAPVAGFTFTPITSTNYAGSELPFTITARDGNGAAAIGFNEPVSLLALQEQRVVTIASNAIPWGLPLAASFHDARLQSIYLANEIGGAGRIVGLALDVVSVPGQTLSNFTIRMRATPEFFYTAPTWHAAGWVTNYQHDTLFASNGWNTLSFFQPFNYSGQNHLMVDFSYDNSSYSADGLVNSTATVAQRSVYLRSDSAYGNPLTWSGSSPPLIATSRVANIRLIMDRKTPLVPNATGSFANGVWTGTVRLDTATTNVSLRVIDQEGHLGDSNPFALILLRISSITRNGNSVDINFPTLNGSRYVVDGSDAPGGSWTPVSPELMGDGGVIHFTHTPPAALQFYRVRVVP